MNLAVSLASFLDDILRNIENRSPPSPKMNIRISWKVETFVVSDVRIGCIVGVKNSGGN